METLRDALERIGIDRSQPFSITKDLQSFPPSIRQIIAATHDPGGWRQVNEVSRDELWTDEVQGVAYDGAHWLFSCNANQSKPGARDKALYTFPAVSKLKDGEWSNELVYWRDVPTDIGVTSHESDHHWGQLTAFSGQIFVSHFWQDDKPVPGKSVVVFDNNNGALTLNRWIHLTEATASDGTKQIPEFQAINPWDGNLYCSFGGDDPVHELFIYDMQGSLLPKTFKFQGVLPSNIQGACFSENGHLFVAVDRRYFFGADGAYKHILCYSALNGHFLSNISVLAALDGQELEGICVAAATWPDGRQAQVHAVLLENHDVAKDNLFFKSFCADVPSAV